MSEPKPQPEPLRPARPDLPQAADEAAAGAEPSGGLTSARESMAAPEEPEAERPTRSLDIEGREWSVTLGGRGVSGRGLDPGVMLGELVFSHSDEPDTPVRMALRPVGDLMDLSMEDLEGAFRVSRPFRPALTGVVDSKSGRRDGGRHRGHGPGRGR